MELLFFRDEPGIAAKAIRWWTKSPYSHVELHFGDGICFSSRPGSGCGWKYYDVNRPDIVRISLDQLDPYYDRIIRFCYAEAECAYDWKGIVFCMVFPFGWQSRSKWFCSEICTAMCQLAGIFQDVKPHEVTPGALFKLVTTRLF
jgi:hypothetical protein